VTAEGKKSGGLLRSSLPFMLAVVIGVFIAWLVVVLYIFPVDPDVATPVVPSVVGDAFDEAEQKLTSAGFVAERGDVRDVKGTDTGKVIEQVPGAGTRQAAGSRIILHIGGGEGRAGGRGGGGGGGGGASG
jgi:beta-lactam-binding protein with PASTA domain